MIGALVQEDEDAVEKVAAAFAGAIAVENNEHEDDEEGRGPDTCQAALLEDELTKGDEDIGGGITLGPSFELRGDVKVGASWADLAKAAGDPVVADDAPVDVV